jgi:hypothetical protein
MRRSAFILLATLAAVATSASAQSNCPQPAATSDGLRVGVAPPPPLPQYDQPPIPAYGDVWTPGYWGWNAALNDYDWIPGVWVAPPAVGLLWTPGYWGWGDGVYTFHAGYWGPTVGFYGGVAYGYGYWGHGYDGGYWNGRTFFYNREYNNLGGLRVNAVYDRRVPGDRAMGRVSYNGGPGGVRVAPTAADLAAMRARHVVATAVQAQHEREAAGDPRYRAGVNHGHPPVTISHPPGAAAHGSAASRPEPTHVNATHEHPASRPSTPLHPTPAPHVEHHVIYPGREGQGSPPRTYEERRAPSPAENFRPQPFHPQADRPAPYRPESRAPEGARGPQPHPAASRDEPRPPEPHRPEGH